MARKSQKDWESSNKTGRFSRDSLLGNCATSRNHFLDSLRNRFSEGGWAVAWALSEPPWIHLKKSCEGKSRCSIWEIGWWEKWITGWWFGCHVLFSHLYWVSIIIPIDELIFFRGVAQPPTSIWRRVVTYNWVAKAKPIKTLGFARWRFLHFCKIQRVSPSVSIFIPDWIILD